MILHIIYISILCSILVISINTYILIYKTFIIKKQKVNDKENNNNTDLDEYLNSLEFNTILDQEIRPLLGNYNNLDITNKVSEKVIRNYMSGFKSIDTNHVHKYVSDVLLNYNNTFNDVVNKNEFEDTEEVLDDYTKIPNHSEPFVDLHNVLNNFYKD